MARRRLALITALVAATFIVAGCDSSYHYVKSSEDKTYFKVPSDWRLFDEEEVVDFSNAEFSDSQRDFVLDNTWRVAFDAAPNPSMNHVAAVLKKHPVGQAIVRPLTSEERDALSSERLRNWFFSIDEAEASDTAAVLAYEELQLDGGFRGVHVIARLDLSETESVVVDQITVVDQATSKVYGMFVGCSLQCFENNQSKIESIVDSWTVRTK